MVLFGINFDSCVKMSCDMLAISPIGCSKILLEISIRLELVFVAWFCFSKKKELLSVTGYESSVDELSFEYVDICVWAMVREKVGEALTVHVGNRRMIYDARCRNSY